MMPDRRSLGYYIDYFRSFDDRLPFNNRPVYVVTIGLVGLFSLIDAINSTFFNGTFTEILSNVPMQNQGFGWVIPGLISFTIGGIFEKLRFNEVTTVKKAA